MHPTAAGPPPLPPRPSELALDRRLLLRHLLEARGRCAPRLRLRKRH
jgi:hypothetical protein